jgi:aromatic-L-amino-acid decarboxylase
VAGPRGHSTGARHTVTDAGRPAYPLEPTPEQMRAMVGAALDYLVGFVGELPDAPHVNMDGALELARELRGPAPEHGAPFARVLEVVGRAAEKGFNPAGPGYLAFVPGGGVFAAAVADLIADTVNRFTNMWNTAPALVQLEANVVRWLCDLFDYPPEARGILTTGGSLANLSAIVAARRTLLPERFLDGTLYVSEQAHASLRKAAMVAGFPAGNVRTVPVTPELRMDADALVDLVRADRSAGKRPFLVIASAGTTNTGAIDPLADLADVAEHQGMWMHADAAYGGPFQMTERGRHRLRGIERSDSITLDPHKAMFLPYGTGSLLVREGERLRAAHQVRAEYLQDLGAEEEIPNFTDYSPELSRDYRGLRVWLPVTLHGLQAFRAALDEKLDLAGLLYEALRDTARFEVPWRPELTAVAFRYRPATGDAEDFNRRLLERINASQRVFLSSTMLEGRFTLRACIVSHRTHRDRIEEAIGIIRDAAAWIQPDGS